MRERRRRRSLAVFDLVYFTAAFGVPPDEPWGSFLCVRIFPNCFFFFCFLLFLCPCIHYGPIVPFRVGKENWTRNNVHACMGAHTASLLLQGADCIL